MNFRQLLDKLRRPEDFDAQLTVIAADLEAAEAGIRDLERERAAILIDGDDARLAQIEDGRTRLLRRIDVLEARRIAVEGCKTDDIEQRKAAAEAKFRADLAAAIARVVETYQTAVEAAANMVEVRAGAARAGSLVASATVDGAPYSPPGLQAENFNRWHDEAMAWDKSRPLASPKPGTVPVRVRVARGSMSGELPREIRSNATGDIIRLAPARAAELVESRRVELVTEAEASA